MIDHAPTHTAPPVDLLTRLVALQRPLLLSHITPDADALGSSFALAVALRQLGARPIVPMPPGSISARLAFMVDWLGQPLAGPEAWADADGVIVLDTAKSNRANVAPPLPTIAEQLPVINIDHHASNPSFGVTNWVVPAASSTCEMVAAMIAALDLWAAFEGDNARTVANLLYAGMLTDTQGFSLSNTTASALATAARLVELGADANALGERLMRSLQPNEFALAQLVYANTRVLCNGRFAYSTISHAELITSRCTANDVDDQVNIPRSIAGVCVAALFSEGEPGVTRVNLRGEQGFAVLPIAEAFNGGGHHAAAGAKLRGEFGENVAKVVAAVEARLAPPVSA